MHSPDLHIKGQIEVRPELRNDVSVDLMWGGRLADTLGTYSGDESKYGPLGYELPTGLPQSAIFHKGSKHHGWGDRLPWLRQRAV